MTARQIFKVGEVLDFLGGRLVHGTPETAFSNFCIDSRFVDSRTLFVPLMGQSRDGHQFAIDAISKGAVAVLVRAGHHQVHEIVEWLRERASRGGFAEYEDVCVIEVRHTLVALQRLAEWFRNRHSLNVIGITGSVGKTGTKEMLIQLLSSKYVTVGTEKNFNNEIGVPLAISKITSRTQMAVIEMAMRARGEISLLSRIAHPVLCVITNTTGAHVGRLGSFDEIYKAKCEIVDGMPPGSTIILNRRDENVHLILQELRAKRPSPDQLKVQYFDASAAYANAGLSPFLPPGVNTGEPGPQPEADIWIADVELRGLEGSSFMLCTKDEKERVDLNLLGRGAIENFGAAAALALFSGMSVKEIAAASSALLPAPQRLNLFQVRKNLFLIDDCYNSSPASSRDSLELLLNVDPRFRKIVVMGDMLELGKYETLLHRQCAQTALNLPINAVYAVGPRMNAVNEVEVNEDIELHYIEGHARFDGLDHGRSFARFGESFGEPREQRTPGETIILDDSAASKLSAMLLSKISEEDGPTVILIKGSRALHLERVVNDLLVGSSL